MKFRTLLLSSAAAFAVVGGAQAADLSVAEPVDYVKVCDAFGAGYWYIPGTDTCLKVGGLVRMDIKFHDDAVLAIGSDGSSPHSASWEFATEAHVNFTAKSMTEYGPLTAFMELRAQSNNADKSNNMEYVALDGTIDNNSGKYTAYLDTAYLELGMLLVGRAGSVYDYGGGFTWIDGTSLDSDLGTDQVRLTWAASGFGIQLAIEDPRDRWGTDLSSSYSMPDIVGNLTWSGGPWSAQLSGGFGETAFGSGFGAQIGTTLKLDQIAPGDQLMLKAAWAQAEVWKFASDSVGAGSDAGNVWMAAVSFQHFWAPTLASAVTFGYHDESGAAAAANGHAYEIIGDLVWSPVTNFKAGVQGSYKNVDPQVGASTDTWAVKVRLERDW